jgi:hypothetical protein
MSPILQGRAFRPAPLIRLGLLLLGACSEAPEEKAAQLVVITAPQGAKSHPQAVVPMVLPSLGFAHDALATEADLTLPPAGDADQEILQVIARDADPYRVADSILSESPGPLTAGT